MNHKRENPSDKEKAILKLFFQGGLQTYFQKDEAQIYLNNLYLDSLKFCVKDFGLAEPSKKEQECVKSFFTKSYQLLNGNLENLQ